MPDVEKTLKDALRGSVEENRMQVAITEESRMLLAAVLRQEIKLAVSEGVKAALNKEMAQQFVSVFMDQMRVATNAKVDAWTGGMLRALLKKAATFLVVGSIVYSIGGWGALAAAGKWVLANTAGK